MHRVFNYGSFLQAYALQQILNRSNATVFFIDIVPGKKVLDSNNAGISTIKNTFSKITSPSKILSSIKRNRFQRRFNAKFRNNYLPILDLNKQQPDAFDLIVIGSDEVFNCIQPSEWGFTTQLFGDKLKSDKIISYAASFGYATYEALEKYNLTTEIKKALHNLDSISVRDNNSSNIIGKITGKSPLIHLDPVLVYDFKNELQKRKIEEKQFIIIYAKQIKVNEAIAIKSFSRAHNKKLISIQCYYDWCDEAVIPESPFDVLNYIRAADFIITDTYHGTIFSIINNRNFCTFVRSSNNYKLNHLLELLCLTEQKIENPESLENKLVARIDYTAINKFLEFEKNRTMEYFSNYLPDVNSNTN